MLWLFFSISCENMSIPIIIYVQIIPSIRGLCIDRFTCSLKCIATPKSIPTVLLCSRTDWTEQQETHPTCTPPAEVKRGHALLLDPALMLYPFTAHLVPPFHIFVLFLGYFNSLKQLLRDVLNWCSVPSSKMAVMCFMEKIWVLALIRPEYCAFGHDLNVNDSTLCIKQVSLMETHIS